MTLSEQYIIEQFYTHNYRATYNKLAKTYQAACGICKEGKSFKTKRRCYYIPKNNIIFCHNCGWSSTPIKWVSHITSKTYKEILKEADNCYTDIDKIITKSTEKKRDIIDSSLPNDSINIFDRSQLEYYKTNDILIKCLKYLKGRRILSAVNRPKALYLSLTDKSHKNRVVIPFVDQHNKIRFYQSRAFLPNETTNYISKIGAEKTICGIDRLDSNIPYVFIFEGPIDSFFIKNGVAIAGINKSKHHLLTQSQLTQYNSVLKWYDKIWVLDNQWADTTSRLKTEQLLTQGYRVFLWPKKYKKYKDLNDLCIAKKLDGIGEGFIVDNTFSGEVGMEKLREVTIQ